jgi:acyl dehydratase
MPLDPGFVGRQYGPFRYTLGVEKMREFAFAIAGGIPTSSFNYGPPEGLNPLFWDEEAAKNGPYGAVIAFPTFAVTFAMKPFTEAVSDPALGIDLVRVVHGEQDFEFLEVMRAGDVIETRGQISQINAKGNLDFLVVETESKNQHGRVALKATWTAVVRR